MIANERAIHALNSAVASGNVQHAYLFSGPSGVGRSTAARRLAQILNCVGDTPPCLQCTQCERIERGIHPDVQTITVEPETEGSARKAISIEQIREAEKMMALNPYEGRTRVVIIDPADAMMPPAQNAFLKTLEEPPPNVVLVLIASAPDKLLETIRSRCSEVNFGLAAAADIEKALTDDGVESEWASLLARLAAGRPGWALQAAKDKSVLARRSEAIDEARSLPKISTADRMDLAERLTEAFRKDRDTVFDRLAGWQAWWRDVLVVQRGAEQTVSSVDRLNELREDADTYAAATVARFATALVSTRQWLQENVQTRVTLDALMLAVPSSR
jgi:DNA polymerase-3 subunit delta'